MDGDTLYCLSLYFLHFTTSAAIIGFTGPESLIRKAGLPLELLFAWEIFSTCLKTEQSTFWTALLGGCVIGWTLQYIEVVLLSKWNYKLSHNPKAKELQHTNLAFDGYSENSIWNRLCFGYYIVMSFRHCGTSHEVKNVAPFSYKDPSYVPSKPTFLLQTAATVLLSYAFLDLAGLAENDPAPFSSSNIPIFKRRDFPTASDLFIRFTSSAAFWLSLWCFLLIIQGVVAFTLVAIDANDVKPWRPAFGPLGEAYSVRRFWGFFWHQYNRQKFDGISAFLSFEIARVPRHSILARYMRLFLSFYISGLMHIASDLLAGMTWEESGALRFFYTQVLGIVLEDGVQAIYRAFKGTKRTTETPPLLIKLGGYLWVVLFMAWSTPVWFYPTVVLYSGDDKQGALPFSVITWLQTQFS
ncbi:hypothetical protein MMC25_008370 [Agyrium rufum]|nr:hypothetical protein [Agyrium rufum]